MKNLGAIGSSVDPAKISATVTGTIVFFSSFIIMIAARNGITILPEDLAVQAGQIGQAVGFAWAGFGLMRKAVLWAVERWNSREEV